MIYLYKTWKSISHLICPFEFVTWNETYATTSHLDSRDEESDGLYSNLDIETNGSDPDYKPLPSEEMHSFCQDIDISDII